MRHVTLVALPRALGSAITIPLEMLNAANDIAKARRQPSMHVKIDIASESEEVIGLAGGLEITTSTRLREIQSTDLVIVPGIWGNPARLKNRHSGIHQWLIKQNRNGAALCGVVTGSHILAEAGLLDGRSATTHWRFFDQFQKSYPLARLQRKRFITSMDQIYCTGSVNAARDLMLHFIEQLFDDSITQEVARHFTHELKRSYESLLLKHAETSSHHDEVVIKIQEFMQDNYMKPTKLNELADRFGMSQRSLNRRFKLATNTTPSNYLQELRIEQAKSLLKESNLCVSDIAAKVCVGDNSYFSSLFRKYNSVTPNEYRKLVRSKLFRAQGNST